MAKHVLIPIEKVVDGEIVTVDTKSIPIIQIPESPTIEYQSVHNTEPV